MAASLRSAELFAKPDEPALTLTETDARLKATKTSLDGIVAECGQSMPSADDGAAALRSFVDSPSAYTEFKYSHNQWCAYVNCVEQYLKYNKLSISLRAQAAAGEKEDGKEE